MKRIELGQFSVGYPIFRIEALYKYRKVRQLTLFEELLMSLIAEFPQLGNNSLGQIVELLKLDPIFLRMALTDLSDNGSIVFLGDAEYEENINNILLREIQLSENGEKFYREKKMPGKGQKENRFFYFNPLNEKEESNPKNAQENDIMLSEQLFPINHDVLKELSLRAMADLKWVAADVSLEEEGISHECNEDETMWKSMLLDLSLDHNNNLSITSQNPEILQWLDNQQMYRIWESILDPLCEKSADVLRNQEYLDFSDDELKLMTLSFRPLNASILPKQAIIVTGQHLKADSDKPCVELSESVHEAFLQEKTLRIPFEKTLSHSVNKLFFELNSLKIWTESVGVIPVHFRHERFNLPVRILTENETGELQKLDVFQNPNLDTLVFMANYVPEQQILAKLPELSIQQAVDFKEKIAKTWEGKTFLPAGWENKIERLNDEKEFSEFKKLFPKVEIKLAYLTLNFQRALLDRALNDENADSAKLVEFKSLLSAYYSVKKLELMNAEEPSLKKISLATLNILADYRNAETEFNAQYPEIQSNKLAEFSQKLTDWEKKIRQLVVPYTENAKFAVIDTDFIRKYPQKIKEIMSERQIIFSQTVIDELDSQKEKTKRELVIEEQKLAEIDIETALYRVGEVTEKIKAKDEEIEHLSVVIQKKQAALKQLQ